jgi:hypothetical protein
MAAPLDRLGAELERAAARQAAAMARPQGSAPRNPRPAAPRWRRRVRARTLVVVVGLVVLGLAAAGWAASSLLSSGDPVPFVRGAPVPGVAEGAPVAGSVKLLTGGVTDPDGGPPWGLRTWQTDRGYGCLQVGRVYDGRLGQISGHVFHELRVGVTGNALGGCYVLDGSGHAFIALHLGAQAGGMPQNCPSGFSVGARLKTAGGGVVRCRAATRTVDFGLLGPHATSYTYRLDGRDHDARALGDVGAYLVVQRHVKPVMREYGFHHKDPKMNLHGPAEPEIALTPASQVIRRVVYDGGTCTVQIKMVLYGSCRDLAGYTPIPRPHVSDVRAPIRAFAAPDGRGIRVRFRARQAVTDGRSTYAIEVRPAGVNGFQVQDYEHDVRAGELVHTTADLYNKHHGRYRIIVRFRTVRATPGPYASTVYPGLLVGKADVNVP